MTFKEDFKKRIQKLFRRYEGEKAALFFRGFSACQDRIILSSGTGFPRKGLLGEDGTIHIETLEKGKGDLARFLSQPAEGLFAGIYEELIAALSVQPSFPQSRGGKILVVENNLFSGRFPSALPEKAAGDLCAFFRGESASAPPEVEPYLNYYGECVSPDDRHYFLSFLDRHTDEGFPVIPFYEESGNPEIGTGKYAETVPVPGTEFSVRKLELENGRPPVSALYTATSREELKKSGFFAFSSILSRLGLSYGIRLGGNFNDERGAKADEFLPLLRRYWGKDASFRELEFYRNPDVSNETERISQGLVISQIARQCALALDGKEYRNVFVTAPTGAGKSLLFQLPALHLALTRGAVTIVVTPLIALMVDQVEQLEHVHGISCATYLNSSITFEERRDRISRIQSGEISIVYLAPELLVSSPLESIIGKRTIGLFVVDEAHIVTTWGKDFRADYWYLGDFLADLRRKGRRFPVLCLTATAVYGGPEDVVKETVESLSLGNPILFLGSVRRPDIRFDIRRADPKTVSCGVKAFKIRKTAEAVRRCVEKREKTLVYCPFVSQVEEVYARLDPKVRSAVRKYYGSMDKSVRSEVQESFREGRCLVMICTKAFGMGVDVKDIRNVYHFAPTGSLADYVQEIGRAARGEGMEGRAVTDFLPTDILYERILYGISEMKQYQLAEILRKLGVLFRRRGRRGLLVSVDTFSYLFEDREAENKVKNGLLLIEKDLNGSYGFPVLSVRPKTAFAKSYVNVPLSAEKAFGKLYGRHAKLLDDSAVHGLPSPGRLHGTAVVNSGRIYELDMEKIWEEGFQDVSFLQFRNLFYGGGLFRCKNGERLSPRLRVRVAYCCDFSEAIRRFHFCLTSLSNIFRAYRPAGTTFTAEDFKNALLGSKAGTLIKPGFSGVLLDMFVADPSRNRGFRMNRDRLRFVASRRSPSGGETVYRIMNSGYLSMTDYLLRLAQQCAPGKDGIYQAFIPSGKNGSQPERIRLLCFLELFGLATYEVDGGKNTGIFVRVNDPEKLIQIARGKYTNRLLTEIRRRHRSSQELMLKFLSGDFTSRQRWDMIEEYFLGRWQPSRPAEGV